MTFDPLISGDLCNLDKGEGRLNAVPLEFRIGIGGTCAVEGFGWKVTRDEDGGEDEVNVDDPEGFKIGDGGREEAVGGSGGDEVSLVVVMEEEGRPLSIVEEGGKGDEERP